MRRSIFMPRIAINRRATQTGITRGAWLIVISELSALTRGRQLAMEFHTVD